jgi:hypothetical protein
MSLHAELLAYYAPGYFGFATSGGGEMFALLPSGEVVCLPFMYGTPSCTAAGFVVG